MKPIAKKLKLPRPEIRYIIDLGKPTNIILLKGQNIKNEC